MTVKKSCYSLYKTLVSVVLIICMLLTSCVFCFAANTDEKVYSTDVTVANEAEKASENDGVDSQYGFNRQNQYAEYYNKYSKFDKALKAIKINAVDYSSATASVKKHATYEGVKNVLEYTKAGKVTYKINVPETGLYALNIDYYPIKSDTSGRNFEMEVEIDGKIPYDEAKTLILKRNWGDEAAISKDKAGNELLPTQVEKPKWLNEDFYDSEGKYIDAFKFYLTKGEHTISINAVAELLAVASLKLHNDGELISYDDYIAENDAKGAKDVDKDFILETENYVDKSDSIVQKAFDRSDPKLTPYSVTSTVYNTVGGNNWNTSRQKVNYEIEVEESGYYTASFKYRQSFLRGMTTYRSMLIDGEIPFKEAQSLPFKYGVGYQYVTAGKTEGKTFTPYKFYLEKGKHILTFDVNIGEMTEINRAVETIVYQLNYIYRKIIIITGSVPDTNRDYNLFRKIPELQGMLEEVNTYIKSTKESLDIINGGKGGGDGEILNTLSVQIDDFIEADYQIPIRLSTFKDNISQLGTWMLDLRNQPLQLDKIVFAGVNSNAPSQEGAWYEKLAHEVRSFISSFVYNYATVGASDKDSRTIEVWVGTARDQALALKALTDNYFTPKTGIQVNISLVPLAVLSRAIIAGKGPDVALHVSRSEPMNLGIRNAVVDLSQFEGYDEVVKRFSPYAMTPYTISTKLNDGTEYNKTFALPETQNFNVMFYRTDIFEEFGIEVPNTWRDFEKILPVIQANNMTVGLDTNLAESNPSAGGLFYTLIQQQNKNVYNDDGSMTNFTEQYAVNAFEKWTNYYRLYSFPLTYSFYTRFRNGEMPLAFQPYSNITYIDQSAPELRGLWKVAPIPGTPDENGNINRTEESYGLTACIMCRSNVKDEKLKEQKQQDAWKFMNWWTTADTAANYGNRVEMAIGSVARYTTSNIEAFDKLAWSEEQSQVIKTQRESIKENPELIGGYYVGRMIINAFRDVTNNNTNARERLFYYNDQINREIWRKRMEYNFEVPEEAKK